MLISVLRKAIIIRIDILARSPATIISIKEVYNRGYLIGVLRLSYINNIGGYRASKELAYPILLRRIKVY